MTAAKSKIKNYQLPHVWQVKVIKIWKKQRAPLHDAYGRNKIT